MNVYDLLCSLGLGHLAEQAEGDDLRVLETDIEVHTQPNYPLKGSIQNVCMLEDKVAIAIGNASEYGSEEAWG
jgi:hypothetical protein